MTIKITSLILIHKNIVKHDILDITHTHTYWYRNVMNHYTYLFMFSLIYYTRTSILLYFSIRHLILAWIIIKFIHFPPKNIISASTYPYPYTHKRGKFSHSCWIYVRMYIYKNDYMRNFHIVWTYKICECVCV